MPCGARPQRSLEMELGMRDLIILRPYPAKPIAARRFTNISTGLTTDAFKLSLARSHLGASGLATHLTSTTGNYINAGATSGARHHLDITEILGSSTRHPE